MKKYQSLQQQATKSPEPGKKFLRTFENILKYKHLGKSSGRNSELPVKVHLNSEFDSALRKFRNALLKSNLKGNTINLKETRLRRRSHFSLAKISKQQNDLEKFQTALLKSNLKKTSTKEIKPRRRSHFSLGKISESQTDPEKSNFIQIKGSKHQVYKTMQNECNLSRQSTFHSDQIKLKENTRRTVSNPRLPKKHISAPRDRRPAKKDASVGTSKLPLESLINLCQEKGIDAW